MATDRRMSVDDLPALADRLRAGISVEDRSWRLRSFKRCFLGTDAVTWLIEDGVASDVEDAVAIGNMLAAVGLLQHVTKDHDFKNEKLFYRFSVDEEDHGHLAVREDGSAPSWGDYLASGWDMSKASSSAAAVAPGGEEDGKGEDADGLQASHVGEVDEEMLRVVEELEVSPLDDYNVKLLDAVHPTGWVDPEPKGRYNLVVIGAGAGGLVTSSGAAGVGARVALIEEALLGGDCLNIGCVPSKALLRCARAAHDARNGAEFGVHIDGEVRVDFGAVMERMRRLRSSIAPHDSAKRFSKLGVDVFIGRGKFTGRNTVEVNGKTLTFAKAVIATGAAAAVPPIEGLSDVHFLTNATLFNLTELPPRFGVIGTGAIGCEMAQAFQRFGSDVTVFARGSRILSKEDPEASAIVEDSLRDDGVTFKFGCMYKRISQPDGPGTPISVLLESKDGEDEEIVVDALLIATGRKPNVTGMGLEEAGVEFTEHHGVKVTDMLQTTNKNIFAVGDVCTGYKFTHVADFMARSVIRNALFLRTEKFSKLLIPWATYTEPELAHVGLYPRDLEERGIPYRTFTRRFEDVDRTILEGDTAGFVRVYTKGTSDTILGATIVGGHAGDMISELTLAMQTGTGLRRISAVIHPYPTAAEAICQLGGLYNRTRLTPTVKGIFHGLMAAKR
eukprot:PLAT300.1.p1 GENE.PLAT300.1~~PLAT300.1.p1  ORF type:complete len:683 (+),score=331.18 PLAT300.1:33-2051(+)